MTKTAVKEKTVTQILEEAVLPTEAPAPTQLSPESRVGLPAIRQELRAPTSASPPRSAEPKHYPAKIAKAILQISSEIGKIQKEGFNEFQRYKYTRWEDINEKLSPLLAAHGLIVVQSEQSRNLLEENDKGSVLAIVYHFTLINEHGDQWPPVEWTAIARLRDQKGVPDDKAAAKCHTQAEKQFCIKQFKIRTDDFIDGDAHSTLPKKDARDVYQKLQGEIDRADKTSALRAWAKENAERVRVLPSDWQDILRDRYIEKLGDLENQFNQTLAAHPPLNEDSRRLLTEDVDIVVDEDTGEIQSSAEKSPSDNPSAGKPVPANPSSPIAPAGAGTSFADLAVRAHNAAKAGGLKGYAEFWGKCTPSEQGYLDTIANEIGAVIKMVRP